MIARGLLKRGPATGKAVEYDWKKKALYTWLVDDVTETVQVPSGCGVVRSTDNGRRQSYYFARYNTTLRYRQVQYSI